MQLGLLKTIDQKLASTSAGNPYMEKKSDLLEGVTMFFAQPKFVLTNLKIAFILYPATPDVKKTTLVNPKLKIKTFNKIRCNHMLWSYRYTCMP